MRKLNLLVLVALLLNTISLSSCSTLKSFIDAFDETKAPTYSKENAIEISIEEYCSSHSELNKNQLYKFSSYIGSILSGSHISAIKHPGAYEGYYDTPEPDQLWVKVYLPRTVEDNFPRIEERYEENTIYTFYVIPDDRYPDRADCCAVLFDIEGLLSIEDVEIKKPCPPIVIDLANDIKNKSVIWDLLLFIMLIKNIIDLSLIDENRDILKLFVEAYNSSVEPVDKLIKIW